MHTQPSIPLIKILPTLELEDIGLAVITLQRLLVFFGYLSNDEVSSSFTWMIDNAVRQFQHDNGLYEDGIVGHHTWSALVDLN